MIRFEPCHHRETTNHSQPSIWGCITTWSTGVGGGPHLTAAHSARQDMCQDALYSKTYHTNHVRHHVSIYVCPLFCTSPVSLRARPATQFSVPRSDDGEKRVKCRMKCFYETRSLRSTGSRFWCNLNLEIISPGSRTRDFMVICRYNCRYAVSAFISSDERIHGVAVVIPTNHREIPGLTPGRYNLQIEITSWTLKKANLNTTFERKLSLACDIGSIKCDPANADSCVGEGMLMFPSATCM